ncbi:hypothetical protein J6590_026512 [Homalodisca vitripennis]|nr:hypothetical protein J6590_026512 [Homalodisca vitripennis]
MTQRRNGPTRMVKDYKNLRELKVWQKGCGRGGESEARTHMRWERRTGCRRCLLPRGGTTGSYAATPLTACLLPSTVRRWRPYCAVVTGRFVCRSVR